jgi:hypothetical protein
VAVSASMTVEYLVIVGHCTNLCGHTSSDKICHICERLITWDADALDSYSGRCSVRFSARTSDNLAKVFRGFPQSFQANAGMVSWQGDDRFLPNSFQFLTPTHLAIYRVSHAERSIFCVHSIGHSRQKSV